MDDQVTLLSTQNEAVFYMQLEFGHGDWTSVIPQEIELQHKTVLARLLSTGARKESAAILHLV